jgi:hypothetical protein
MKQGKDLYFLLFQKTITTRISLYDIRMVKYKKTKGIDDYHCPAGRVTQVPEPVSILHDKNNTSRTAFTSNTDVLEHRDLHPYSHCYGDSY